MPHIPRDDAWDSTIALFFDGYRFIAKRCRRCRSNIFLTRLLLQKTVCLTGEEWARTFYTDARFSRFKAAPQRLQRTLFGIGGVQGLDGRRHRRRKDLFMTLVQPESIRRLVEITARHWRSCSDTWAQQDQTVLLPAAEELLCRAVCEWAGVPLKESDAPRRTADMAAMIDGAGAVGVRHWRGRKARQRTEVWIGKMIDAARRLGADREDDRAVFVVARHRDLNGELLDRRVAAVELINILRPTVAIARFIVFAAAALHRHPQSRSKLRAGDAGDVRFFVQEVRRFYPFFPFAAARVKSAVTVNGYRFPAKARVLLDLYGTNHDPRIWKRPMVFDPDRFRRRDETPYNFIPQGGGYYYTDHRCPGERMTIPLLEDAVKFLVNGLRYEVPRQDLHIDLARMPAQPKSGFIIRNIERRAGRDQTNTTAGEAVKSISEKEPQCQF